MKDNKKKVIKAEKVKEEKGIELTDEQMAEVNAGLPPKQTKVLPIVITEIKSVI